MFPADTYSDWREGINGNCKIGRSFIFKQSAPKIAHFLSYCFLIADVDQFNRRLHIGLQRHMTWKNVSTSLRDLSRLTYWPTKVGRLCSEVEVKGESGGSFILVVVVPWRQIEIID